MASTVSDIFVESVSAETTQLLSQMRAEPSTVNWLAWGYKEGEDSLVVLGSGSEASIAQFEHLFVDDQVVYVLFAYTTEEEAYGRLVKRVLITFVGPKVKPLHKARSSQHRVQLYAFCGKHLQLAGEFHPESKADVTEKAIAQKLSGSRLAEGVSSAGSTAAAATGSPAGRARAATTRFYLADEAKSSEMIKAVRNDSDPTNWVAWTYAEDIERLHIRSSGSGGYAEFVQLLQDDVVIFGLLGLKVKLDEAVDHSQTTTKYILVTWVGPKVTGRPKARSATDRVALYDFCNKLLQLGAEWQALSSDEISEEMLIAKLSGSILQVEKQVQEKTVKATVSDGVSRANWDYQPQQYAGTARPDLENEELSLETIQKIRDRELTYAVFGYKADGKSISLLASGSGGYNDVSFFFDEKAAVFVVLGLVFGASEYGGLMKYPYICWIGPKVKPTVKARASQHRVLLYNWIFKTLPLAGEVQALTAEEISEDIIRKKMVGTTQLAEQETSAAQAGAVAARTGGSGVERFDFVDAAAVEKAFKEVRDDTKETNWCLIEYENEQTGRLQLASAGHGGLDAIKSSLAADKIVYVVLGFIQDEGDYSQVKYIFVTWVGDNTKPTHKARSSQHRVKLYAMAKQHLQLAGEIQILSADELNEKSLAQKLSGSRMVTETEAKTAVRETKMTKGSMEKFKIEDEAALQDVLTQMRKDNNPVDWVVLGYPEEAGKGDVVRIVGSGKGSLAEVQQHFPADRARYAIIAYKVVEVVDDVDYTRAKNVFLSWIGKDVKPLQRAKTSQHRVPIYEYANRSIQMHAQIHAEKESDLSEEIIMEKLTGSRTQSQSRIQAEADRLKKVEQEKEAARVRSKSVAPASTEVTEIKTMLGDRVDSVNASLQTLAKRDATHWLALGYKQDDGDSSVHILGQGTGGIDECHAMFKEDEVVYAFVGIHEEGQAEGYNTLKYILVTSVGQKCKPLHKARSSQHRVALYAHAAKYIQLAGEMQAISADEITLAALRNKLTGAGKA